MVLCRRMSRDEAVNHFMRHVGCIAGRALRRKLFREFHFRPKQIPIHRCYRTLAAPTTCGIMGLNAILALVAPLGSLVPAQTWAASWAGWLDAKAPDLDLRTKRKLRA